MNVVTHSYSAAFWSTERWMQEIDWMALSGVNLPLAFTGQEWAFYRTYTEHFGLSAADLDAHFVGPAFLAWGRMGNIRGWGGRYDAATSITGLTMHWMEQQRDMQKLILARVRGTTINTTQTPSPSSPSSTHTHARAHAHTRRLLARARERENGGRERARAKVEWSS